MWATRCAQHQAGPKLDIAQSAVQNEPSRYGYHQLLQPEQNTRNVQDNKMLLFDRNCKYARVLFHIHSVLCRRRHVSASMYSDSRMTGHEDVALFSILFTAMLKAHRYGIGVEMAYHVCTEAYHYD